jgi:hypothetical protein
VSAAGPRLDVRRRYGAHPAHLIVLLGCFTLAAGAAWQAVAAPRVAWMAVWFAAAVVLHDLVLFPLYTAADRGLDATLTRLAPPRAGRSTLLTHIRVPALASGLLFLVFLPGILQQGEASYLAATGQTQEPFLGRWLLATAALFALSAALLALRRAAHRIGSRPENR